jgi:hypothetical protein
MIGMHKFRRDSDHKLRALQHADKIGDVGKACRYFGVGRARFYLYGRHVSTATAGFKAFCRLQRIAVVSAVL